MFLGHEDALVCAIPVNVEAEEIRGWATIGAFESRIEVLFKLVEFRAVIRRN